MKKGSLIIEILIILAVGSLAMAGFVSNNSSKKFGDTMMVMPEFMATTSPYEAITPITSGKNLYMPDSTATTGVMYADTICLTGDSCETTWPAGGAGSQTPWTSNIDGGGYYADNINYITATGTNATSTFTAISIGTTTHAYALNVDGAIQTDTAFYGDTWSSATDNSMAIQPTGDTDDFFSFKTPANRPTIKREGGKFIYLESSNVYDVGISARADDTYSGTLNYEKDNHMMTMLGKASPLGFKANSDYDDYIKIQTASNIPEMTVASSSGFKINAGGTKDLLLNHDGGNVGIGTTTASSMLTVGATTSSQFLVDSLGHLTFPTASSTALTVSGNSHLATTTLDLNDPLYLSSSMDAQDGENASIILQYRNDLNVSAKANIAYESATSTKIWLAGHDKLTATTTHNHFSIETKNASNDELHTRFDVDHSCDDADCEVAVQNANFRVYNGKFSLDTTQMFTGQYLDIVPNNLSSYGGNTSDYLRIATTTDSAGIALSAFGGTYFQFNDDLHMTDNDFIGLGVGAGQIEFDDQATDEINFLNANVGIGTQAPTFPLEIVASGANTLMMDSGAGNDTTIRLRNGGSSKWILGNDATNDSFGIDTGIALDSSNLFTILSDGNVGIGTTSPAYPLDVYGNARVDGTLTVSTPITDANVSDTLTVTGYMQDEDVNTFAELNSWITDGTLASTTHIWDFSSYTNATAGTGITFTDDSISADLGTTIVSGEITDGTIAEADLDIANAAVDEYVLSYEADTSNFQWVSVAGGGDITDVFDCATGDCNTMTVGTSEYLTYGSGYINANRFAGVTTVDGTEFGYLNGVTSGIQTQFDAKSASFSTLAALNALIGETVASTTHVWDNAYIASSTEFLVDNNTTYTAGDFLTLTGTDFDVDTAAVTNGDTTHLSTADAIYDWGVGLFQTILTNSAGLLGALNDETGTGVAVFNTSPTLVTPALGTPSALVGTNITGTGASFTAGNATALANARTIGGVSFDGTANIVPNTITVADTTDTTSFVALWESATGDIAPKTDAGITYNAGTGMLTATGITAPLTGNSSTATALAGNGANCSAGSYPLGVNASGAVESCTDATTEINAVANALGGTNLTCSGQSCSVDDAFVLHAGDIYTGVHDIGGATSLEIPNAAAPVTDTAGEISLDTTDNQLLVADSGGTARVIPLEQKIFSVTVASTSVAFVSGGVLPIPPNKDGFSLTKFKCYVKDGTSVVINVSDGTNDTETITCATTLTSDEDVATNDTFTAGELAELQFGTITGSPNYLSFTAYGHWTRE